MIDREKLPRVKANTKRFNQLIGRRPFWLIDKGGDWYVASNGLAYRPAERPPEGQKREVVSARKMGTQNK